jgi:hypothetical protein
MPDGKTPMTKTGQKARSIKEILMYSGPSRSEGDEIVKLVRAGKRSEAVKVIEKAFDRCTAEEAETIYDAYVEAVVGRPSKMVEVNLSEVEVGETEHDLQVPPQYVARRASFVGWLERISKHAFSFNGRSVDASEIDQVWKLVPVSDGD